MTRGLKNVHNDTCYPALLVIGQFMDALKSGKYNPDTTALLLSQTGGGCRASNYIHLLRKALAEDFPQVPVISLNFSGLERAQYQSPAIGIKLVYAVLYEDLLMLLYNQLQSHCRLKPKSTDKVLDKWQEKLATVFAKSDFLSFNKYAKAILDDFAAIPRSMAKKPRVGIVGEIYVKYSPLANNHLEEFLISEGCEPIVPGLLNFVLYCCINTVNDGKFYNFRNGKTIAFGAAYKFLYAKEKQLIKMIKSHGEFLPPDDFEELRAEADKFIHQGVKMGGG